MIGLVIVTHGQLAEEFVKVAKQITGEQKYLETVCIAENDNIEEKRDELLKKVAKANNGKGVIVLTDMFGGTASNIAISITQDDDIETLAGINLPLLIELLSIRGNGNMKDIIIKARDAGRKYIHASSALLENVG